MEFWSPATAVRSWRQNLLKMLQTSGILMLLMILRLWMFWMFGTWSFVHCIKDNPPVRHRLRPQTWLDQMTRLDVHFLPSVQRDLESRPLSHCLSNYIDKLMTISKYIEKSALERATTCPQDWWTLEGSHKQPRATRAAARRLAFIAKNLDPKKWWTSKINDMQNNIGKKQSKDEQSNAFPCFVVLSFCQQSVGKSWKVL